MKPVLSSYGCYSGRYRVRSLVFRGRGAEGPRHWRCLSQWRRPRCRAGRNQYLGTATRWEFQRGATLPESNSNPYPNRAMSIDVKYDTTPCDGTPGAQSLAFHASPCARPRGWPRVSHRTIAASSYVHRPCTPYVNELPSAALPVGLIVVVISGGDRHVLVRDDVAAALRTRR